MEILLSDPQAIDRLVKAMSHGEEEELVRAAVKAIVHRCVTELGDDDIVMQDDSFRYAVEVELMRPKDSVPMPFDSGLDFVRRLAEEQASKQR